jgi:hypothetical protein
LISVDGSARRSVFQIVARSPQHHQDVGAPGVLLRLDLARQLRRRRLREVDPRHDIPVRLDERVDHRLGQLRLPGHVDDRQVHRLLGVLARRAGDGGG